MKKKLYRSTTDRKIAGVCGGLAEYFGIDSTLVRIIFAIACLCYFSGILLYILCVIIIPNNPGYIDTYAEEVHDDAHEKSRI